MRSAWLFALLAGLSTSFPASADDPKADPKKKVVSDVLARLKEKREQEGNERYKLTLDLPNGQERRDFQIDWKTGMFRLAGETATEAPHEGVEVYDGKQLKTHFRRRNADKTPKGDWQYGLNTGTMRGANFRGPLLADLL